MQSNRDGRLLVAAKGLAKTYIGYNKPLARLAARLGMQVSDKHKHAHHALKPIDFSVCEGECIGVIGRNGAGKSTLLQMVAGTLRPSGGTLQVDGKISAILELGSGFNPEFSGRENARLGAALAGFDDGEFEAIFARIADFADIGDYIDEPVKTYSSGMYVRLAFAVAIAAEPDILIVDEALAVGDALFQRKCFRRIEEMRENGVTIFFVSHSMPTVLQLCDRALYINDGRLILDSSAKEAVQRYREDLFGAQEDNKNDDEGGAEPEHNESPVALVAGMSGDRVAQRPNYNPSEHRWGDGRARIVDYIARVDGEELNGPVAPGANLEIKVLIEAEAEVRLPIYGLTIRSTHGVEVYGVNTRLKHVDVPPLQAGGRHEVQFRAQINLLSDQYFISLGVAEDCGERDNIAVDRRYDVIDLQVDVIAEEFGIAACKGSVAVI